MNSKLNIWKILFLLFLAIASIYIIRNNQKRTADDKASKNWQKVDDKGRTYTSSTIGEEYINNKGAIFGTFYSITYRSGLDLHNGIRKRLAMVDNSLSPFNKQSLISAINENRDTVADDMFTHIFTLAQDISEKTNGAFDITVAPLVNAWGFGFKNKINVDSATVDSLRRFIGYKHIALNDGRITKQFPETMLNCSAIAKGYGCDAVAEFLKENNVNDFLIEIGGEVVASGKNPKSKEWTIGISKPVNDPTASNNELQKAIRITDKSMATSGNYRNFRYEDGRKVAHTIDPRTGYPVNHSLLSATVVADNCATADAYATAFMVLGLEKAMEICDSESSIEAYLIYSDDNGTLQVAETEGMKKYY